MDLVVFSSSTTNLFPVANSDAGGQLLSEFNLRARETVATPSSIQYVVGPSYTHSVDDLCVSVLAGGYGEGASSTSIQISPGRALVNGHYIESLIPITIDIADCNATLKTQGKLPLRGRLAIGLRAMYSTKQTLSNSLLTENGQGMYRGVQVVILPVEGVPGTKFTTPKDSPTDESKVNAHLKLAEFTFANGGVSPSSISNDPERCKVLDGDKISFTASDSDKGYVSKQGLNPKRIYTFSGKGTNPETGGDTWCDSTDSLMIWDANPTLKSGRYTGKGYSEFVYSPVTGKTQLVMAHKQPDGMDSEYSQYYADKTLYLPTADYGKGTGGTVDSAYTACVKDIDFRIQNFYRLPQGKLKHHISGVMSTREDLPPFYTISTTVIGSEIEYADNSWSVGDYVTVEQDGTVGVDSTTNRMPSTMYLVLPGFVTNIAYAGSTTEEGVLPTSTYQLSEGVQVGFHQLQDVAFDPEDIETVKTYWSLDNNAQYIGQINKDYFKVTNVVGKITTYYFYAVTGSGKKHYSDPLWITPQVPLATEGMIGGFYNAPDTALGSGYIRRNDNGYLQLLDYDLLVSGVLAYQLGESFTCPAGLAVSAIQTMLDDYVNERVAFPNASHKLSADNPNVIDIYIELSTESEEVELNIHDIDSRFGTVIHLHFTGTSDSNTTINIKDCQKLRITNSLTVNPVFNLFRCNLYYDPDIIEMFTLIQGMSLWYERFETSDVNLQVDGMTVELIDAPTFIENEDYWSEEVQNDNHYSYALRSLTFGDDGNVIGCSLLVTDTITANIQEGTTVTGSDFVLPQGVGLYYPSTKMIHPLKVCGTYITAYPISSTQDEGFIIKDTNFTALTDASDYTNTSGEVSGKIAFHTTVSKVRNVSGLDTKLTPSCWESGKFNIFHGGMVE